MSYFVARCTEDGLQVSGPMSEEELKERITPDPSNEGSTYYGRDIKFLSKAPQWWSHMREGEMIIVKGEIVVPQPKQKVVEWEVP